MPTVPSAPLTLLFTDIEGSTRLARTLGDGFGEALETHNRLLRDAFAAHGGTEVDSAGDGFFVVFERARDAVAAAVEAQRALAAEPWDARAPVKVRMGIHTGEVTVSGERYRGIAVHRAARISAVAYGGQVVISQSTQTMVEDAGALVPNLSYLDLGDHRIKDFDRPVRLYQLLAPGLASRFPPLAGVPNEDRVRTPAAVRQPEDARRELEAAARKVAELAAARGRHDLEAEIRTELASPREPATVVVVAGEAKRGKSSLINALLGRELLPTDADIATSAHVIVRYGPRASVLVLHAQNPAGEEVALEDLAAWATPWGNPNNEKGVRGIAVSLEHPLLARGVTLVDTPGVGGLDAAHAAITKAALLTADVLLFVVDASAPLSRPELRFLEEATDRIQTVFFALTKRDEYRGWERVLSDNRALLAGTRYAAAPVFPVSSTMELGAGAFADDPELARLMHDESGIEEVRRALAEQAVGKTTVLRAGNLLRLTQHVLELLDELEQAVIEAAGHEDGDGLAELQAARQSAMEFRATRGKASRVLEKNFRALGQQVDLDLNRALAEVRSRYDSWVEEGKMAGLPQALESEMHGVVVAVNASLLQRLDAVEQALRAELQMNELFDIAAQRVDVRQGRNLAPPPPRPRSGGGGLIDVFGSVTPVSMITSLAISVLGSTPLGLLLGGPVGLLLGGAIWTKRRGIRSQQQARAVLTEAVDWARRELPPALRDEIGTLKDAVEAELHDALEQRERVLAEAIAECERVARETSGERKQLREAAVARRKEVVQMRAAVAALRNQLAQASQLKETEDTRESHASRAPA
jgi:class 3 adenylate cyclase